jgi:hypothetical protein
MKKFTHFILASLTLVAALGLTGCVTGNPPALPEPEPLPVPDVPENFTTYTEESNLFSISHPDDWSVPGLYVEGYEKSAEKLRGIIAADLSPEGSLLMFQAGLGPRLGSDPTVSIHVKPLPSTIGNLDEVIDAETNRRLESMRKYYPEYHEKELSREITTVNGMEAIVRMRENETEDSIGL